MTHKDVTKFINTIDRFFIIIFTAICFLGYMIPQWFAFFVSHPFFYTNAWDDANYLTYQVALGVRNTPGYFALYLVSWLQSLGISGAIQNLIFDTLLPPLTAYLIYKTLITFDKKKSQAVFYAVIILFASVLFNYSNINVVTHLNPPFPLKLIVPGWETYPSIIRTPNPLFSYFLLSIFIYLFAKHKKKYLLLLPMPFLYYFVLVPYLYILATLYLTTLFKSNNISRARTIIFNLTAFFLVSTFVCIAFNLTNHLSYGANTIAKLDKYYSVGRDIYLPLVGLFGLAIYFPLKITGIFTQQRLIEFLYLTVMLAAFAITNLQLVTNFALEIKTYQDYGCSLLGGILIALLFEAINQNAWVPKIYFLRFFELALKIIFILYISRYVLLSQGFSFSSYNFLVNLGPQFTAQQLTQLKQDPLHTIVIGADASQKTPYGIANSLAPVFSYQYNYPFVFNQCQYNPSLASHALQFIHQHFSSNDPIRKDIDDRAKLFFSAADRYKTFPFFNKKYCQYEQYNSQQFYVVIPVTINATRNFPNW